VRVLVSTLAAGLMIAMASGCGAGSPSPVRSAYTSIMRSQAHAVARELTIRVGDLPEFKITAHPPEAQQSAKVADEVKCRPAPKHRVPAPRPVAAHRPRAAERARPAEHRRPRFQSPWASANSDRLSAGSGYHVLGAYSSASILPAPAAARLGVAEGANLNDVCLAHAIRRALSKTRLRVRGVVVKPLPVSVPGADASVAYQTIIGVHGVPLVLYMDSIAFAYGQDVVTLTTYHSSRSVPRSMEERLLGLLVARARSHTR
jgi:hypothetical protein